MKCISLAVALALTGACALPAKPPTVTPVPVVPIAHSENMTAMPGASGELAPDTGPTYTATAGADGRLSFIVNPSSTGGAWLTVRLAGDVDSRTRIVLCLSDCEQPVVVLVAALPPVPTRDQILLAPGTFQGLTVTTECFGGLTLPLFDVVIASMSQPCREVVYAAHTANGDRIISIALSWCYQEPNQPYATVPCQDYREDLPGFRALADDVVQHGFYARAFLAGDGFDRPANRNGWWDASFGGTSGPTWTIAHLPEILDTFSAAPDLTPFTIFVPGFDGVIDYDAQRQTFVAWTIPQVNLYLTTLRAHCPACYSAIEPSAGVLGGILTEFLSPAARDALDQILHEFDSGLAADGDRIWQNADRALGPAFRRPPEMPATDDANCPPCNWTLRAPTSRGPIIPRAFEYHEYQALRGDLAGVAKARAYLKALGYPAVD